MNVRDYLEALMRPPRPDQFGKELRRLTAEGKGRSRSWRFNRESLHERLRDGRRFGDLVIRNPFKPARS